MSGAGAPQNLRPPFKKGQSGNPAGRPKGLLSMTTLLKKALNEKFTRKDPFTGKTETKDFSEWVNVGLLAKAMKGDVRAVEHIYERTDGKVTAEINVTTSNIEQRESLQKDLEKKIESMLRKEKKEKKK